MLLRAGAISLMLWALAASQAGATRKPEALSSTSTTEAPESTAATRTEPPAATTTTTTTNGPSTDEEPQTTPTTTSAGSSTAAPHTTTGAPEFGADEQSPGESRLSFGGKRVFEAPSWLGIVRARPVYADRFGGLVISVGAHRLVMHTKTYERAHRDEDFLELFGFGMKEYRPEAEANQRGPPINFKFYSDSTLRSGLVVGNFSFSKPRAHRDFTYSNITLAPLQWNTTASRKVGDCILLSYDKDEDSDFRHLTSMPVRLMECDNARHECKFIAAGHMGNEADWGLCEQHHDLGSPVVCNGKLSFIVSDYHQPDDQGCELPFMAVELAHFGHQIVKQLEANSIGFANTPTNSVSSFAQRLMDAYQDKEKQINKYPPAQLANIMKG